ncbi:MAG: carboxypeptidase-like regulatory domain-containing protein, partial [Peptococcaceae bacterium]|nr:carboxypeptidase-like regulatory domain-containing protein [Peptococcaceae bacterium]
AEGSNVESDTPKGKKPAFGAIVGRTVLILKDESSSVESSATPLSGAHLRLMVKKGKKLLPAGAARSSKDGNFIFKKVKPGSYLLTAWAKGFKPKNPSVIVKVERGNITKAPIFYFYAVPNNHPNAALKSRPVTPPVSEDNSPTASGT